MATATTKKSGVSKGGVDVNWSLTEILFLMYLKLRRRTWQNEEAVQDLNVVAVEVATDFLLDFAVFASGLGLQVEGPEGQGLVRELSRLQNSLMKKTVIMGEAQLESLLEGGGDKEVVRKALRPLIKLLARTELEKNK